MNNSVFFLNLAVTAGGHVLLFINQRDNVSHGTVAFILAHAQILLQV